MSKEFDETGMKIAVARNKYGIVLSVKTNPIVEAFMRNLGNGTSRPIEDFGGNLWAPVPGAPPLMVWDGDVNTLADLSQGPRYRLDSINSRLEMGQGDYNNGAIMNLSFLRLVGMGEGSGISFILKNQVISKGGLIDLRDRLASTCKQLYSEYIRPVDASAYIYQTHVEEKVF